MPYYRRVGEVPPKRHTQFRDPHGALYAEELMSQQGFSSGASLLYHKHAPTALLGAETVPEADAAINPKLAPNHPLLPYHLRTSTLPGGGDLVTGRTVLLANDDVRLAVAQPEEPSDLYRNAWGDEIVYLRQGSFRLESTFGCLDCGEGDYVVIPRGTTHRWMPLDNVSADAPRHVLVIEASGHVGPPSRYLSPHGQFLEHSPYCERDLHGPSEPLVVDGGGPEGNDPTDDRGVEVLVRQSGGLTRYRYAHHPFDVVGWDGYVYPYRFSIHDFEPITGRIHQPPPVHQTFAGPRFVVCSFVPRKLDYHPAAVPTPYNHANVDCDEVLYYCSGSFTSRKGSGIEPGSLTLHPGGHTHGPQPGSVEASLGQESTDELAVMIDAFRPLQLAESALASADPDYPWSWA
jgi:homogentisate 1,2-dioxygenase